MTIQSAQSYLGWQPSMPILCQCRTADSNRLGKRMLGARDAWHVCQANATSAIYQSVLRCPISMRYTAASDRNCPANSDQMRIHIPSPRYCKHRNHRTGLCIRWGNLECIRIIFTDISSSILFRTDARAANRKCRFFHWCMPYAAVTSFRWLIPANEWVQNQLSGLDKLIRRWYEHISIQESVLAAAQQRSGDRHVSLHRAEYICWSHSVDSQHHFRLNTRLNRSIHFGKTYEIGREFSKNCVGVTTTPGSRTNRVTSLHRLVRNWLRVVGPSSVRRWFASLISHHFSKWIFSLSRTHFWRVFYLEKGQSDWYNHYNLSIWIDGQGLRRNQTDHFHLTRTFQSSVFHSRNWVGEFIKNLFSNYLSAAESSSFISESDSLHFPLSHTKPNN